VCHLKPDAAVSNWLIAFPDRIGLAIRNGSLVVKPGRSFQVWMPGFFSLPFLIAGLLSDDRI
jgi:hypothetical protein